MVVFLALKVARYPNYRLLKKMTTDVESTNSEKIPYIKYYWCTFTDSTNACVESACIDSMVEKQTLNLRYKNAVLLPETDERIQKYFNPNITPEELYIQYITLTSIEDLFRFADAYDRLTPKPIYRGQSDYSWELKTQLELNVPEFVIKDTGLETYEYRVLCEAQRRFHDFLPRLPDDYDQLSWLALLRHRGVPTRLLDVTRSFFIACYFALRDARPGIDAAVWVFSRQAIDSSFFFWSMDANENWLRKTPFTVAQYGEPHYWPYPKKTQNDDLSFTLDSLRDPVFSRSLNFVATLDAAMRGYIEKPGVAVVEPFWLSRRNDFQQGAFLIPFNVRFSFEHNLRFFLGLSDYKAKEREVSAMNRGDLDQLKCDAKVIKLRIPASLHAIMKIKLESMNIRELTLFPDIDGALAQLSALVPRQEI